MTYVGRSRKFWHFGSDRLEIVRAVLLTFCVVLVLRVAILSLVDPFGARAVSVGRVSTDSAPAERGDIVDRNGTVLAMNTTLYTIGSELGKIPVDNRWAVVRQLAELLSCPVLPLTKQLTPIVDDATSRKHVDLARRVSLEAKQRIEDASIAGLTFRSYSARFYPKGSLAGALIGYIDHDGRPQGGLEWKYTDELAGRTKYFTVGQDGWKPRRVGVDYYSASHTKGLDLILTIDEYTQHIAETELSYACETHGATAGCAIVLDHKTGDILALAAYPPFDPNRFNEVGEQQSFAHPGFHFQYEPGSIMKTFTYALALRANIISPTTVINCENGEYRWGNGHKLRDNSRRFSLLTAEEVLAHSSNIGSAKIVQRMGRQALHDGLVELGFGRVTSLGLPSEKQGILYSLDRWRPPMAENIAFGHGMTATAVQVAQAYGVLGNGGVFQPIRLVRGWRSHASNRVEYVPLPAGRRVFSAEVTELTLQALRRVVADGTGGNARLVSYTTAGKTGTANKVRNKSYVTNLVMTSFAGFLPAYEPQLTIVVMIDEPQGHKPSGGRVAAPCWSKIALQCAHRWQIPPDKYPLGEPASANTYHR